VNPAVLFSQVAAAPRDELPAALIRVYLGILMAPGSAALSLLKAATTNESAARMLREYVESVLLDNAHRLTDLPNPRLRVAFLGSHMIGIVFARLVIGIEELTRLDVEDFVPILTPVVERYLFEPLDD
jgi:Tetracyclin repressor-like, C-terminal domain